MVARRLDHSDGFVFRLNAVDGFLHCGIEVLHADADAVKAEFGKGRYFFRVSGSWVNFNRVFARSEFEVGRQHGHERGKLG